MTAGPNDHCQRRAFAAAPRLRAGAFGALGFLVALAGAVAAAQPRAAAPRDRGTPLGARQEHVRRMMRELDDKLIELARELETSQPEQVEKLVAALAQSKESLLENRMAAAAKLLNDRSFERAGGEQQRLVDDLQHLMATLLAARRPEDSSQEQAQLEAWTKQLAQLIAAETAERRQAHLAHRREEAAARLAARRAQIEALVQAQQELLDTAPREASEPARVQAAAERQAAVREQTAAVAEQAAVDPVAAPAETTALERAVDQQAAAEESLTGRQPGGARRAQQRAVEELRRALETLSREQQRIADGQAPRLVELAAAQDQAAGRAAELGEQMADDDAAPSANPADQGSDQSGEQSSEQQRSARRLSGKHRAAQQAVGAAQQAMGAAAKELRNDQPEEAEARETDAIEQLASVQDELLERLAELQRAARENQLAELQTLFRELLRRQQAATTSTAEIEHRRNGGKLRRADRLAAGKLAAEEASLAKQTAEAGASLERDRGSLVFKRIIRQLHEDCLAASAGLRDEQTGAAMHSRQREIEETLKSLLSALEDAKAAEPSPREPPQPSSDGESNDGESNQAGPLAPAVAELKLLRSSQRRVNERTLELGQSADAEPSPTRRAELDDLAARQRDLAQLARELAERAP